MVKATVVACVQESIEVSTITKDLSQTEKTKVNLKYCTKFCKQWHSKEVDI